MTFPSRNSTVGLPYRISSEPKSLYHDSHIIENIEVFIDDKMPRACFEADRLEGWVRVIDEHDFDEITGEFREYTVYGDVRFEWHNSDKKYPSQVEVIPRAAKWLRLVRSKSDGPYCVSLGFRRERAILGAK